MTIQGIHVSGKREARIEELLALFGENMEKTQINTGQTHQGRLHV